MSQTQSESGIDRRTFLRRSGAGAIGTVGVIGASNRLDLQPVGQAEAFTDTLRDVGTIAASTAIAGPVGFGWALRETEVIGSNPPPEGMSPEAFVEGAMSTAAARKSDNASTFIDNQNIFDGIEHSAYSDGKIAAIEALNEQESQSDVVDAAQAAANSNVTTIEKNLLRSWNETMREAETMAINATDYDEFSEDNDDFLIIPSPHDPEPEFYDDLFRPLDDAFTFDRTDIEHEHPDGSTMDIITLSADINLGEGGSSATETLTLNPLEAEAVTYPNIDNPQEIGLGVFPDSSNQNGVLYANTTEWNDLHNQLMDTLSDVNDGLITWVDGVYGDVQAGELDTAQLLTPRELAELQSDDEDFNQAVADLMALNVSVDLEREAEIYFGDVGATVYGSIARTGDGSLETGTVDPADEDESFYLTYDVSQGEGTWDAYETGIDGGTLTITEEPFEETLYVVNTAAGESASVAAADFNPDDDEDPEEWTVDLSDQLDDRITEVESIEYYSEIEDTQYETVQLQDEFEIVTFRDSDGEEYEDSEFTRSEPQSDENYITEDEWQEQQERYEELIAEYEDAQNSGGISLPGFDEFDDLGAGGLLGGGAVALVVIFALIQFAVSLNPVTR